ncbi:MAG: hypothetical protein J0M04_08700 [Verrucomicrobia bacterium]|nr:hypothetical protein [Verrucomicrobiota bacterium]
MKQITVITPANQAGTLADLAERLAKQDINILDMEVLDDHTHGVIILHAEPHDLALRVLAEAGYHAASDDLLVIRIEDQPGGVARIAARFREPALNIRSMRIARRDNGWATVILSTDDNTRARELLSDCLAG